MSALGRKQTLALMANKPTRWLPRVARVLLVSVLTHLVPLCRERRPRVDLGCEVRRTEVLKEVGLPERHTGTPQDGVGSGDVEEEVGERKSCEIFSA
jgi:hypothetical protein